MEEPVGCRECGADNPLDARFCIKCGASLTVAVTGQTRRLVAMVCPNCGAPQAEGAQFCAVCGQRLAAERGPRTQPSGGRAERQGRGSDVMNCPICSEVRLVMADRQGIEVDYCPNCRGVWLDRGELDKIIERVAITQGDVGRHAPQATERRAEAYREHRDYDDDYRRKKRRRGLLDELFDFDD